MKKGILVRRDRDQPDVMCEKLGSFLYAAIPGFGNAGLSASSSGTPSPAVLKWKCSQMRR